MRQSNTFKRLGTGLVLTAFLVCCFLGTSMSLRPSYAWAEAPAPCLNNGNAVFDHEQDKILFEPGAKWEKAFFIQSSSSTEEVRYFLYFDIKNMENPLVKEFAETLQVSILDTAGNELVCDSIANLQEPAVKKHDTAYDVLKGRKDLVLQVYYPGNAGNAGQLQSIEFDIHLAFLTPENTEG